MTQSILEEYNENIITRQTMLFKQQHIMNKKKLYQAQQLWAAQL